MSDAPTGYRKRKEKCIKCGKKIEEGNAAVSYHDQCLEDFKAEYMPTPEEITAECAKIRRQRDAEYVEQQEFDRKVYSDRMIRNHIEGNRRGGISDYQN